MLTINFPENFNFEERSIKLLRGMTGIYFIYLDELQISYPFTKSRLIYIGLSESKENSIGRRLYAHLVGQSGNYGIKNYAARYKTRFTYHSFQLLQNLGAVDLYEIENFFLSDFLRVNGSFPICNNQSGVSVAQPLMKEAAVNVEWEYFA